MRHQSSKHMYNQTLINPGAFPEIDICGHSGGSFYWTVSQAKKIDEIGLNKWLKSDAARGYGVQYGENLKKFLS